MENLFKKSVFALVLGASALAFSANHSFAFEVVTTSTVDPHVLPYPSIWNGKSNTDYAFRLYLSNDANWTNFAFALNNGHSISEANLNVWLTPLGTGFDSDRHRFLTTSGWVTDENDLKLTLINSGGIDDQVVRLRQEEGISLNGVNFAIGQPTEYEFDLTDWYSADDIEDLILANAGIINIGHADDSFVLQGELEVKDLANPETASLLLFGSVLAGFAAWRLRKSQHHH